MFTISNQDGIYFVKVSLEKATQDHSKQFREFLLENIVNNSIKKMVIDFEKVMFIDSSFLSSLVTALKKINEFGGDIKITSLEPPVRLMFELTRLYHVFEIFETVDEATANY